MLDHIGLEKQGSYLSNQPQYWRNIAYTFKLNSISRGLENPKIVEKLYNTLPEDKLDKLCR